MLFVACNANTFFVKTPEIIATADRSHTLFHRELNEHYHSVNGAITESQHVFLANGFCSVAGRQVAVLEAGFGTGLNALLTAMEAARSGREVRYVSLEKFPLAPEVAGRLNYPDLLGEDAAALFLALHRAPWNEELQVTPFFALTKIRLDLVTDPLPALPAFDVVYFDAFGPDKQPEMWQPAVLSKMTGALAPGGVFVTYSAKGEVRRNLQALGLSVERVPGPPGKKEMLRGIKIASPR